MRGERLIVAVMVLIVATLGYEYVIVVRDMRRVGIQGWSPSAFGQCGVALRYGYLTCGSLPASSRTPPREMVMASVRLWTGTFTGSHTWLPPDSASWARTRDSVRQALARDGGKAIQCRTDSSEDHPALAYEIWQLPGQSMRLVALKVRYKWIVGSPWQVNIMTIGRSGLGCDPDPPRRRLLTPHEVMQRLVQRLEF